MNLIAGITKFRTDPQYWAELDKMLNSPVFRFALELARSSLEPKVSGKVDVDTAGRMGMFSAGGYAALKFLETLATEFKQPDPEEEEFSGWAGANLLSPEEVEELSKARTKRRKTAQ